MIMSKPMSKRSHGKRLRKRKSLLVPVPMIQRPPIALPVPEPEPKVDENRYKVLYADNGFSYYTFASELNKWAKLGWRLHSYTRDQYGRYEGILVNDEY